MGESQSTIELSNQLASRIQTFPDTWKFACSLTQQYKQIGNAVPVNLTYTLGTSLVQTLNEIEKLENAF